MLQSRAKASIVEITPGIFHIYVRGDFLTDVQLHTFYGVGTEFPTYQQALQWYTKRYPQGELISFDHIRLP